MMAVLVDLALPRIAVALVRCILLYIVTCLYHLHQSLGPQQRAGMALQGVRIKLVRRAQIGIGQSSKLIISQSFLMILIPHVFRNLLILFASCWTRR